MSALASAVKFWVLLLSGGGVLMLGVYMLTVPTPLLVPRVWGVLLVLLGAWEAALAELEFEHECDENL